MSEDLNKPRRIRITARCHMDGALREPGYETVLAPGVKGPHRTFQPSVDRIDYDPANGIDANRLIAETQDIPLYTLVEPPPESKPEEPQHEPGDQVDRTG